MVSSDRVIIIEIDGKTYRLNESGHGFQQEVLNRLDGIESRLGALESRVGAVERELGYVRHDQANLQTSVYWGLAVIGIFLAAIAVLPSWSRKQEKPDTEVKPDPSITPSEILRMINAAMDARLPKN